MEKITLKRNGLTMECFFTEQGKLQKKIEYWDGKSTEFAYQFDDKGHLLTVRQDGEVVEKYKYNQAGQRVEQQRKDQASGLGSGSGIDGSLYYDKQGKLAKAGETAFEYAGKNLEVRWDCQGLTRFYYGKDTLLDKVELPSGAAIRYEYDKTHCIVPARRFKNGRLLAEYVWQDAFHLAGYLDQVQQLEYTFLYDAEGILDKVRIGLLPQHKIWKPGPDADLSEPTVDWLAGLLAESKMERLRAMFSKPQELRCGTDHVGTLKILTDAGGKLFKEIQRDSFGLKISDSFPDIFMPLGYAGGVEDPDTGLVHFGYRDYDPSTGRFTAPDPLGDTGGDHDLYDYCVDDPVTMNDPAGLFPPLLLFLGGKALALGLGLAGTYGAAKVTDWIKSRQEGKESSTARDSVRTVTPWAAGMSAFSALPGAAPFAPGAIAAAERNIGAPMYWDKMIKAGQFAEGAFNPMPSAPASGAGAWGMGTAAAIRACVEYKDGNKSADDFTIWLVKKFKNM
jgi:RHS repeat-associated protein